MPRDFYARDTLEVARDLLGKKLVRARAGEERAGRIVEVEAYKGVGDLASHARAGPTKRAAIMFGPAGVCYVYMIYGMHFCMNVVAHEDGRAGAVLVRAVELEEPEPRERTDGPAKLARALAIDRALNGADLVSGSELWIEDGGAHPGGIVATPRIGVAYAGSEWASKPWRLVIEGAVREPRRRR